MYRTLTLTALSIMLFTLCSLRSEAQIKLPAVFGDNMVLQQQSEIEIWGWADAGHVLAMKCSWLKDTLKTTPSNTAFWTFKVKTPEAGGPHTISFKSYHELVLKNVMVGEVWLCSGQSNMEMNVGWGIKDGEAEAAKANYPNIRFFSVKKKGSALPQEDCYGNWAECTPASMRSFSAAAYFFARQLNDSLKVPIGILHASWGGSPAEVWTPKQWVENDSMLNRYAQKLEVKAWWPSTPGACYNAMIAPLVPFRIAGALWYQGESNVDTYQSYSKLLKTMVQAWRKEFKSNFPFYYVQIAPYTYGKNSKAYLLREEQGKIMELEKTGMVVVSDLVNDTTDIHPKNKTDVGKRLANLALSETYGFKGIARCPIYKSMKIEKSSIRIDFSYCDKGLTSKNQKLVCFEIAGEDQKFVAANAKIEKNTLVVSAPSVKKPVAVRFSFSNAGMGNLFNSEGFPVAPFRTDNWPVK